MLFLSPLLLWFLAAAAVPVAIHLINRRRHKTIAWAAMQFLLKAARQSRGKKRLRHFLILACRALGVAALALAAARPVASGLLGWGGGAIDTVVLVLDRSASMELKPGDGLESRRRIVLDRVRESMDELGAARLVLIDSASGKPQEIATPELLAEFSAAGPTDSAADLPALLTRAAEYLADGSGRAEIWLASDLQQSNWQPDDDRWAAARSSLAALPRRPAVRVLALTGATAANQSVRLLATRRAGDELLLDLEVFRAGEARGSVSLPVTTEVNGTRTTDTLTLPGQSLRFQKRVALPAGSESGHGWLSLPADGNPRDNAAFFAYGPARTAEVRVVAAPGEAADCLLLAAAPPGLGALRAERIDPEQAARALAPDVAAVLWAAPLPEGQLGDEVQRFVDGGGQVLFLPPTAPGGPAFQGVEWSAITEAAPGKFLILRDWDRTDGPMRDSLDGTPVAATRLKALRRQVPTGAATPLARWDDGEVFLARRVADRGTAWFLGSLPDYSWSNLGDADVLLPVVQRIVAAGAARFDASHLAVVGAETSMPAPGETRVRLDGHATPDPANAAYEAGVYRVGDRLLAVNRPAAEDSPEILAREQLDRVLEGTGYTLLDQAGQAGDPSLARDVWRAFLVAVLAFLIAEALLCLPPRDPAVTAAGPAVPQAP